ncbi:MAG: CHAT domain-containing protein [Chloroflexota bacterium]
MITVEEEEAATSATHEEPAAAERRGGTEEPAPNDDRRAPATGNEPAAAGTESILKDDPAAAAMYGSGAASGASTGGPTPGNAGGAAARAPAADGVIVTDGRDSSSPEAVPQEQADLAALIKGIGAARNQWLRERLNITTVDELAQAAVDVIEAALRADKKSASRADIEWWIAQAQALVAGDPAPERVALSLLRNIADTAATPATDPPIAEQPAVVPPTQPAPVAVQGAPIAFTVQLLQQATAAATGGNRAIFRINNRTVQLDLKRQDVDFGRFESNLVVDPVRMRALGNKPRSYGQALFAAIINNQHPLGLGAGHTAEGFQRIQRDLATDGCAIEYELDSNSDELHEYRWELLDPPDTDDAENPPPAVKARHPVYRLIRGPGGAVNRQQPPGRIVILIANPKGLGDPAAGPELAALQPLEMAQELAVIEPVTRRLTTKGVADVVLLDGTPGRAATWQNLMDNLTSEVNILHIVAHGVFLESTATMFHLVLESEGPEGYEFIDAAKLESGLKRAGRTPRLVILAACNSALAESGQWKGVLRGMGPRLVRNTPGLLAVIAMQKPLRMTDSRLFNHYFYDHLLRSGRVDVALAATRSRLYDENPTGDTWATPVLFMSTQDGQLFSAESTKEKLPQFDDYTPMPAGAASANSAAEATLLHHMQALAQAANMPYLLPQLRPDAMPERPLLLRQDRERLDRLAPVELLAHELRSCIEIAPDDPACPQFSATAAFRH